MAVRKNADGSITVGILPEDVKEKAATKSEAASPETEAPKKRGRKPKQE